MTMFTKFDKESKDGKCLISKKNTFSTIFISDIFSVLAKGFLDALDCIHSFRQHERKRK